jgi:hypothetical protein
VGIFLNCSSSGLETTQVHSSANNFFTYTQFSVSFITGDKSLLEQRIITAREYERVGKKLNIMI